MDSHAPHHSKQRLWPVFLGSLVLVLLFAILAKLFLASTGPVPDEDAARAAERSKALEELNAENKQKLETYAWADKAKGTVQMPIQQAMEMTIRELNSREPAPAGPINALAPAAAPSTDAAPAAAPAATHP